MVELQPVDAVEATPVVDNFVDILLAGGDAARAWWSCPAAPTPGPSNVLPTPGA